MLSFIVSSVLGTHYGRDVAAAGMGWSETQYLAMTWAAVGLEALTLVLARLEWRMEFFTPKGQPITCYWKPAEVDSWLSVRKNSGVPRSEPNGEELGMELEEEHGVA